MGDAGSGFMVNCCGYGHGPSGPRTVNYKIPNKNSATWGWLERWQKTWLSNTVWKWLCARPTQLHYTYPYARHLVVTWCAHVCEVAYTDWRVFQHLPRAGHKSPMDHECGTLSQCLSYLQRETALDRWTINYKQDIVCSFTCHKQNVHLLILILTSVPSL